MFTSGCVCVVEKKISGGNRRLKYPPKPALGAFISRASFIRTCVKNRDEYGPVNTQPTGNRVWGSDLEDLIPLEIHI